MELARQKTLKNTLDGLKQGIEAIIKSCDHSLYHGNQFFLTGFDGTRTIMFAPEDTEKIHQWVNREQTWSNMSRTLYVAYKNSANKTEDISSASIGRSGSLLIARLCDRLFVPALMKRVSVENRERNISATIQLSQQKMWTGEIRYSLRVYTCPLSDDPTARKELAVYANTTETLYPERHKEEAMMDFEDAIARYS